MKALDALASMCNEDEIAGLRIAPLTWGGFIRLLYGSDTAACRSYE